jgi:aarF domain-containing kinase
MIINAILVAWRTSEIIIRLSPLVILTPAAKLIPLDQVSNLAWKYTLYTVQSLGPAYIKVCQWAATRRDLFPQNICDRLGQLHDGTSLHSWDYTHRVLSKAFGIDYHSTISGEEGGLKIHPKDVIGSGAVAQVYKGTLTYNGEEKQVAIKVLHPNIQQKIERDLKLMERLAQLLHALPSETVRMMNLPRVCGNFAAIMRHQIDLRNEARHLQRFRKNFVCDDRISKIRFPMPLLADENCLVEDYEDAIPMSTFLMDNTEEGMRLRRKLAGPLLRAFLKMVFMDNFVHSDLHQGNIKVRRSIVQASSGKYVDKYTIVFLDAGIVTSLNKQDKQNLKDLFKAVITNNGEEAGRLMVERAKYERCSKVEGGVAQFSKGVEDIVSEFHDRRKQGLTLGVVRIGTLLSRVLDLCRVHGVEIDPAMSNIVMSTLVLEGLGRCLDPDANLFDIALPFVLGFGKV